MHISQQDHATCVKDFGFDIALIRDQNRCYLSVAYASLLLGKDRVPEECIFTCPHFLKSLLIVSCPVHVSHCFPTLALNSLPQWPLQSPSGPNTCCSKIDGFVVVIFIGLKDNLTNHGKIRGFHGFPIILQPWRRQHGAVGA